MIDALKRLFEQSLAPATSGNADGAHAQNLAVAALLVEMIRADHQVSDAERDAVARALHDVLKLDDAEVDVLLRAAEGSADDATSLFEFTRVINERFEHDDKVRIVEQLWQVAYSDGELEKHESHLVRKVADLLHLRHREYIAAKLKAAPDSES